MRPSRKVELTDEAIECIKWQHITRAEFEAVLKQMKRIAAVECPGDDDAVCVVECTDLNWYRAKHVAANIRTAFVYDEYALTVTFISRRVNNTYKWVKYAYKKWERQRVAA